MGGRRRKLAALLAPCLATWNSFLEFWRCGRQQTLRCSYNQKRWAPRSGTYSGAEAMPFIAGLHVRGKTSLRPSQMTHSETCPPGATATSSRACWAFPEDPMRPVGGRVLAGKRGTVCSMQRRLPDGAGAAGRSIPQHRRHLGWHLGCAHQRVDESSGDWTLSPSYSVT